tara:strand:+ start:425 stop:673 length:249 start_codon:yes stop_codon:yes gene_type:complete
MATVKTKNQDPKEKFGDAYHLAEEATSEAMNSLKDQAKESLNESSEKIKSVASQAENMIKERPLLSIGCAFLAGWAISKLIK